MRQEDTKIIGAIGLGYWGKNILRNLYELGVLHAACDTSNEIIIQRKKEFPNVSYTDKFEEILQNPKIKAVAISTPAITHYELTRRALLADKDVFVEKPLALTLEQGKKLVDLAHRREKILMVGHLLQYHPAVVALRDLVVRGALGQIQYVYSNRLNIGKLRVEENVLWSFAPHDISVILMLIGEEPFYVSAFGGKYINEGVFDTTLTTLGFKDGVRSHVYVSWLHPYKEQKFVVVGSKAMAVFDDCIEDKLCLFSHKIEKINGNIPIARKAERQIISIEDKEPLREELRHFIECVIEHKRPKTDGEEALRVLSVLEKATEQLKNN